MSELKKISVYFSKETFGYALWTMPKKSHNMAFVHATDIDSGMKKLTLQLGEIHGGTWQPTDEAKSYIATHLDALDDGEAGGISMTAPWTQLDQRAS